ncbi:lytic polysaccharide monooxygenase [Xylona heveae TC161]|uniref:Lytic polysaccharide monooxygenase n=1 Tax=Xylona heveae (strain CBS 132557 / TC161) TaxID=1328760 RepID=A0A165AA08_XYLHT|nr:lytic polysaccharide monooxygenase [Xylona heveae TC161]KZF20152.1 lytic polysaccharide monooxygenase [Xylona heveae TC161]
MHFSAATVAAAVFGFSAYANAHIIMTSPVPYGKSTLNNSPLSPDGSDFPCKLRQGAFDTEGADNEMRLGDPQKLEFEGMAVHGGGSCQVSIAYTRNPDKDTKFKVIKSFEGGCPARNVDGNIQGNTPTTPLPDKYNFTIPADLQTGEATIAWTWFNKVGNREMYMNCAPVTLTGGNSKRDEPVKRDALDSLPDLFVANVGNGCNTADSTDLVFPNPGNDVEKKPNDQSFAPPQGNCQSGSGSSGNSSSSSSESSSTSAAQSSSASGGVFVTAAAPSSSAASVTVNPVNPVTFSTATRAAATAGTGVPTVTGSSGNGNGTSTGSCSKDQAGQTVCSADGKQIGTCNVDGSVVFGDVADGTVCEKGYQVAARSVRAPRAHVHRRHGHSHNF